MTDDRRDLIAAFIAARAPRYVGPFAQCEVCGNPANERLVNQLLCADHAAEMRETWRLSDIMNADPEYIAGAPNHSPFSLAFEQSERELGERLGYPALVYQEAEPRDITLDVKTGRISYSTATGEGADVTEMAFQELVLATHTIAQLNAELTALTKAANLAYDAIDWQLEGWEGDVDGPPPSDLLNAHAALYGLLRYAKDPENDGVDLPF